MKILFSIKRFKISNNLTKLFSSSNSKQDNAFSKFKKEEANEKKQPTNTQNDSKTCIVVHPVFQQK